MEDLVFVDFLFLNQSRGAIFSNAFPSVIEGMAYSCLLHCEKMGSTVDNAIAKFLLNKISSNGYWYGSVNTTSTGIDMVGWVFVKEYDYKKSYFFDDKIIEKYSLFVTVMDSGWVSITTIGNSPIVPNEGKKIINSIDKNVFIFAIFKSTVKETEFSRLYESRLAHK